MPASFAAVVRSLLARADRPGTGPEQPVDGTAASSHLARAAFLRHAAQLLSSSLDVDETVQRVAAVALQLDAADWVAVALHGTPDGPAREVIRHRDDGFLPTIDTLLATYPPSDDGPAHALGSAWWTTCSELVRSAGDHDVAQRARDPRQAALVSTMGARSWICVPLQRDDDVHGVLTVASGTPIRFDESDLALASAFALLAAPAIDNARLHARVRAGRRRQHRQRVLLEAVLNRLSDGVVACDPTGKLTVVNASAKALAGNDNSIRDVGILARQVPLLDAQEGHQLGLDEHPLARALHGEDVDDAEVVVCRPDGVRRTVICSGEPLIGRSGEPLGAVMTVHDVTEQKLAQAELVRQAMHDALTGLPNRLLLLDRMRQALARSQRKRSSVALLFVDLDRFKVVNDTLGHQVGDQVLAEVARRLTCAVRPADTVARLGGDEFVVLCEDVEGPREALDMCARVRAVVALPYAVSVHGNVTDVVVDSSVGVALDHGEHEPEELLRNADVAMYRAKQSGKAREQIYDASMRSSAISRMGAENDLRRAIADNRLRLLYQPILDLRDKKVRSVEALVRYESPDGNLVAPAQFLPVAEETGLITEIGAWVLTEACAQLGSWRRAGVGPLRVSVNLSARQLGDPELLDLVAELRVRHSLAENALALEITETVLMEYGAATMRILDRLKAAGCGLGLDDFGTGYSSLTYLRRFPVDFVKVDQSFVAGLCHSDEDTAIVRAVIGLGKSLGLTTIAEGVETEEQATQLELLGCDRLQGFHFGRPQPGAGIPQAVATFASE